MELSLTQALRLKHVSSPRVAFVGAGGKTTAIFQLAQELAPCIVTTTTHLGAWQANEAQQHVIVITPEDITQLEKNDLSGIVLVTGKEESNKLSSLSNENLVRLTHFCDHHALPLLIEADGARRQALKAPRAREPAIPAFTETAVAVAGVW
ncbi:MAG: putative selenium-dependent hydroxylase accessory protein YqeC, partial [Anaerolineales bacterium]|nr:putative selenium-dependent hydroxylase accessory protein YqeC [Anaerolineales bacterium]